MERILLLMENKRDRRLIEEALQPAYQIWPAETEHPFEQVFELAIVDGPSLKRRRAKIRARRKADEPVLLPFLLVTTRRKGSIPLRHLGGLVDDIIVRPIDLEELQARLANLLRMRRLSLELKKEHDLVTKLSVTDDVTGFHNTRYLHRYLDRLLSNPGARDDSVSLVFFDLDNFKEVVDTHGHLLGAKVLKEVAQAVHRVLDEEDRIVRYGGDEFVVILPRQTKDQALAKAERMIDAISETPYLTKEHLNVHVTASFGLATFPDDAGDKRGLLQEADHCLFRSKTEGKNRLSVAGPMDHVVAA
jgi:diguanylate cyclase (GGDEF)-like protein